MNKLMRWLEQKHLSIKLALGLSFAESPISQLQKSIEDLAAGNLNVKIPLTDYPNEIGDIARSLKVLQKVSRGMELQRLMKQSLIDIDQVLLAITTYTEFGQVLSSEVIPMLRMVYGALYILDSKKQILNHVGGYGCDESMHTMSFAVGQGLIGQAAKDCKKIILEIPTSSIIGVSTGLGIVGIQHALILPIVHHDNVLGVFEVGSLVPIDSWSTEFLDNLIPALAEKLQILVGNVATRELLQETLEQSEFMMRQSAQLEEQTVEMEMQQLELKDTESWFRSIIELAPEAIFVMNDNSEIILCNPKAEMIFGYAARELDWKIIDTLLSDSIFTLPVYGKTMGVRKDGSQFPVEVSLSYLPNLGGRGECACVAMRDITIATQAADTIRDAKELAENATKMKSDFLSNMSHEIRTPMNAILGMSHLVLKTDLTPRQSDYVKKIQGAGQHLLDIINDILDFSKIEAGKLDVENTDFEFVKVLDNLVNLISEKTHEKGLELLFDIDKNVPQFLNGDSLRLSQILINYSNNAVKFTKQGEIVISAKVLEETETEVFLHFAVSDTGIGLTSKNKDKLFQPFQQADTSTSRKYGGTGLGLAIAKQLAELMHGEVGVDSEIGKGSTFWFTAKLGKAEGKGKGKEKSLMPSPDLRGRHVLIVDDNEMARHILNDLLISMSFKVAEVKSGEDALKIIQKFDAEGTPFEVIYLDWRMPEMDGIETAQAIQDLSLNHAPHIIMVTAHGREEVIKEIEYAGIENILIKPLNASILFDTMMRVLGHEDEKDVRVTHCDVRVTHCVTTSLEDLAIIKGAAILIVEDIELNQEVAMGLLEDGGFDVHIANDGKEAVEMVAKNNYDIVLMDMQMPVMDGVTATIEIRKDARFKDLPIVAMTANAMQQDREACAAAGMNDHVAKPIDPDELFRALLKWIKPKHTVTSSATRSAKKSAAKQDNDLPIIEGLDVELGLKRVIGKKPLYFNMLRKYGMNQENTSNELRAALAANDYATAERVVHSAKGVSGNIGASDLQAMAGEIEKMIHEKVAIESILIKITPFEIAQKAMLTALKAQLPPDPALVVLSTVDMSNVDTSKATEILANLRQLLTENDSEADDVFQDNLDVIRVTLGEDVFSKVNAVMQQFNFKKALEFLSVN